MITTARTCLLLALALAMGACAAPRASLQPTDPPNGPPATATDGVAARSVELIRSPTCGCCAGHAEHLAAAGYAVNSTLTEAYTAVKDSYRIPADMRSCHTALVGRYFVEGHVPAAAIDQLLAERPEIDGIALPGMPAGAPGMGGTADGPLTVFAISDGRVVGEFGRFDVAR